MLIKGLAEAWQKPGAWGRVAGASAPPQPGLALGLGEGSQPSILSSGLLSQRELCLDMQRSLSFQLTLAKEAQERDVKGALTASSVLFEQ